MVGGGTYEAHAVGAGGAGGAGAAGVGDPLGGCVSLVCLLLLSGVLWGGRSAMGGDAP